jgi:hypothetical protein
MSMAELSTKSLEARRKVLLDRLAATGPFVQGSLCKVAVKCGKPRCRCAKGDCHEAYVLSKKVRGRTVTTHIPRDLLDEVTSWAEQHKRLKKLIRDITELSENIIRVHVGEKRRANQASPGSAEKGGSRGGARKSSG